jgi:hypothetical protein
MRLQKRFVLAGFMALLIAYIPSFSAVPDSCSTAQALISNYYYARNQLLLMLSSVNLTTPAVSTNITSNTTNATVLAPYKLYFLVNRSISEGDYLISKAQNALAAGNCVEASRLATMATNKLTSAFVHTAILAKWSSNMTNYTAPGLYVRAYRHMVMMARLNASIMACEKAGINVSAVKALLLNISSQLNLTQLSGNSSDVAHKLNEIVKELREAVKELKKCVNEFRRERIKERIKEKLRERIHAGNETWIPPGQQKKGNQTSIPPGWQGGSGGNASGGSSQMSPGHGEGGHGSGHG